MTKLTNELKNQLIKSSTEPTIKDDALDRWFSGHELEQDVQKIRTYMTSMKVIRGDKILLCLDNSAVYTTIEQAAWEIGVIVHPMAATTPLPQLQSEFNEHDYALVIVKPSLADHIFNDGTLERNNLVLNTMMVMPVFVNNSITDKRSISAVVSPQEDDLALILNTSGTTGKPKRVGLTHAMIANAAHHNIESHGLAQDDVAMIVMPMFHINAQVISTVTTRLSGGKLLIAQKFSASKFWHQVRDNHVTWVSVVPTIISILLINEKSNAIFDELKDQIDLHFVRCASFALPENKLISFQERFGAQVVEAYGMTEAASQVTINPMDAPKVGSAGKAVGTDLAVLVDGKLQRTDTDLGEIAIRGDHVISDYLDTHPDSFHDGWLCTGDLGYVDSEGYLFIKGRSKEMINHGGEKVAPAEVESVLTQLDFVADIAVIGLPDDLYGEAVTAVIQTKEGVTESQFTQTKKVLDYAKHNLATFEQPSQVRLVNDFPRNPTGKILRPRLKEELLSKVTVGGK